VNFRISALFLDSAIVTNYDSAIQDDCKWSIYKLLVSLSHNLFMFKTIQDLESVSSNQNEKVWILKFAVENLIC